MCYVSHDGVYKLSAIGSWYTESFNGLGIGFVGTIRAMKSPPLDLRTILAKFNEGEHSEKTVEFKIKCIKGEPCTGYYIDVVAQKIKESKFETPIGKIASMPLHSDFVVMGGPVVNNTRCIRVPGGVLYLSQQSKSNSHESSYGASSSSSNSCAQTFVPLPADLLIPGTDY